jgi:hypothetical protein
MGGYDELKQLYIPGLFLPITYQLLWFVWHVTHAFVPVSNLQIHFRL